MTDYPELPKNALKRLTVFPSTYLCETAFSPPTYWKSKLRNNVDGESDLTSKLSETKPNIACLLYTSRCV